MKVMTNEERIKMGVKEQHERIRKVLSPRAIEQMNLERWVMWFASICFTNCFISLQFDLTVVELHKVKLSL